MKAANDLIAAECESSDRLNFIDIWQPMLSKEARSTKGHADHGLFIQDGLHLSATGYDLWTSLVKPHLLGNQ